MQNSRAAQRTERKLVIIGDGGVGKSTLVRKLMYVGPNFTVDPSYTATLGVEVYPLTGIRGDVVIWDCAGQEQYGGLRDGYWQNANAVIVMCTATSVDSANNVASYIRDVLRVCPGARVMVMCNLFDSKTKQYAPMSHSVQTILNNIVADYTLYSVNIIGDSRDKIYNAISTLWH